MAKVYVRDVLDRTYVSFWCVGCDSPHTVPTRPLGSPRKETPEWGFNGDAECPTLEPSVHSNPPGALHYDGKPSCHVFVRDGKIEYLSDCTHWKAGETIELPPYPDNWK